MAKAGALNLHTYQHLSLERTNDLFDWCPSPSEATLLAPLDKPAVRLEPFGLLIKEKLLGSEIVHADEMGMRIDSKLNWLRAVWNDQWTFYDHHPNRGEEAIDAIGLPQLQGSCGPWLLEILFQWKVPLHEFSLRRPPFKRVTGNQRLWPRVAAELRRGRIEKNKTENLAERFILYNAGILRFLWPAPTPFDNNRAERDTRMTKVKEKISASFRAGRK